NMRKGRTSRILLTHTPEMFRNYYGERALASLRELGEVRLHEEEHPLAGEALVTAAQGCEIVVSDFKTPADAPVFEKSPQLVAFLRCAVDIRTIDVAAASRAGVLVTRASPGFVAAVTELVLGLLVDLSRGISRSTADYHGGGVRGHEAGRVLRQRLARQPRRRGGPGARSGLGPAGRLRHRRRPRGRADAQSRHRGPLRCHRDAARWRSHAAGDRAPGVRDGR